MRTVPTLGGIELGPKESSWIDVVPLARSAPRGKNLLILADELARQSGDWRQRDRPLGQASPASPDVLGVEG